jgi:hypothetical protein
MSELYDAVNMADFIEQKLKILKFGSQETIIP